MIGEKAQEECITTVATSKFHVLLKSNQIINTFKNQTSEF